MPDPDQSDPSRRAVRHLAWLILLLWWMVAVSPARAQDSSGRELGLPFDAGPAALADSSAAAATDAATDDDAAIGRTAPAAAAAAIEPLPGWMWPTIVALLILSFSAAGSETALFSIPRSTLKRFESSPGATATQKAIVWLMADPKQTLTTLLLLNLMANIGTSLLVGAIMVHLFADHPVLSFLFGTVAATLALLIFGEIFPKSLAIERAELMASFYARPVVIARRVLLPVRAVVLGAAELLFRLLRLPPETSAEISEQEIRSLIAQGLRQGVVEDEEREMISGVFDLESMTVDKIMTPRVSLQAYPDDMPRGDLERQVTAGDHSRVLIFHESIDRISGVLHAKDLLLNPDRPLNDLVREPMFVPPKKLASSLLRDFQRRRQHIAVVLDEYGGTAGCITLNDVLEEIVGDILEADEIDPITIRRIDDRRIEIDGLEEVDEVNDTLGIQLPTNQGHTVSGLILNVRGDMPRLGESVVVEGGYTLRVKRMAPRHVQTALLILPDTQAPGPAGEGTANNSPGSPATSTVRGASGERRLPGLGNGNGAHLGGGGAER
jgi:CBS domain containing-hemolysin-like protein